MLLDLAFHARLHGPCFRCLDDAVIDEELRVREYQAEDPQGDVELVSPYVDDGRLDLSAWAHDAVVLALPDKILCREECAGLCPECGKNLNLEPHEHEVAVGDPRWAPLAQLKERLVVTPDPKRWQALGVLGIAYLMVVLDISIVNVALPSIQEDLDFSTSGLQWVVSGYALTFGGLLLLGGRSGDILGRRKVFMAGLAPVRALLAPLRPRVVGGGARRLPALPGRGRRDPLPVRVLDHARDLRGGR